MSSTQTMERSHVSAAYGNDSSAHIKALVSGYPGRLWHEKLLVMFQAYVDDSVSELGERKFYLCAYVSTASQWIRFSDDWDEALKAPPTIAAFHMVDAWSYSGEFRGWSESARNAKLEKMASVVKKYKPLAVEVSLSLNKFEAIFKDSAPFFLKSPYFMCFYGMIITIGQFHKQQNLDVPVDFIFDKTTQSVGTIAFFEYVKEQFPELSQILGSTPIFRDDVAVVPLQAADMLAWCLRRKSEGRNEHIPGSGSLVKYVVVREMTEESLRGMAEKMAKMPGVKTMQTKKGWSKLKPLLFSQLANGTWPRPDVKSNRIQRLFKWLLRCVGLK